MGGCTSKQAGVPVQSKFALDGAEADAAAQPVASEQSQARSPRSPRSPRPEENGERSPKQAPKAGEGPPSRRPTVRKNLEDEKKAISDNVRTGQFLDYYDVGSEVGRYVPSLLTF